MQMEQIDQDILEWIAAHTANPELTAQINGARVKRRDAMKTGFFVYFEADTSLSPVDIKLRPVCPYIEIPGLPDGAGCDLFMKDGYLAYLEIYARGGFMPENPVDYALDAPR